MLRGFLHSVANIRDSSDVDGTIREIESNVELKGYNLWILVCAALLASIGLDTNSTAVIIGAMLISPLMSPILGIGLALGRHDNELIRHSLRNFTIAVLASLAASTLYFSLTPLGEETAELLARTRPTILDVLVAFFGGIAGIVANSRRDKTTAIPGVAIATALMPPLCTAGFGIATGRFDVALGALYLFVLNAVFIALATLLIVSYLRFPVKHYLEPRIQKRYSRLAVLSLVLLLIPSAWFLYSVYRDARLTAAIRSDVVGSMLAKGREVLNWKIDRSPQGPSVLVYYAGSELSDSTVDVMQSALDVKGFSRYRLSLRRINMTRDEVARMSQDAVQALATSWEQQRALEPASANRDSILQAAVFREALAIAPSLRGFGLARRNPGDETERTAWIVSLDWSRSRQPERSRLVAWLRLRLSPDSVLIHSSNPAP